MKLAVLLFSFALLHSLSTFAQQKDSIYSFPPLMPEYHGGVEKMNEFIRTNKRYPINDIVAKREGRVWISAVLDTTGLITNANVVKGISPGIDSEALFLVSHMPRWLPGYTDNGPVRTKINIPIDFSLADTAKISSYTVRVLDNSDKQVIEIPPSFRGNMMQFVSDNLNYPVKARDKGIMGKVYVQFIINENGYVTQPKVVKSSGSKALDDEAIRVVTIMPRWNPGVNNGTPVKVYFNVPITFKIE